MTSPHQTRTYESTRIFISLSLLAALLLAFAVCITLTYPGPTQDAVDNAQSALESDKTSADGSCMEDGQVQVTGAEFEIDEKGEAKKPRHDRYVSTCTYDARPPLIVFRDLAFAAWFPILIGAFAFEPHRNLRQALYGTLIAISVILLAFSLFKSGASGHIIGAKDAHGTAFAAFQSDSIDIASAFYQVSNGAVFGLIASLILFVVDWRARARHNLVRDQSLED